MIESSFFPLADSFCPPDVVASHKTPLIHFIYYLFPPLSLSFHFEPPTCQPPAPPFIIKIDNLFSDLEPILVKRIKRLQFFFFLSVAGIRTINQT